MKQLILILAIFNIASTVYASRVIPDDNLAYPILITVSNQATGSGFYINTRTSTYLVTARHVFFNENGLRGHQAQLLSYPRDITELGSNLVSLDFDLLEKTGGIQVHDKYDVVVIKLGNIAKIESTRTIEFLPGVTLTKSVKSGLVGVAVDGLKRFADVLIANSIIVFGYPTSLGLENVPQIERNRPLLRTGIIAGKNEQTKHLILDCPVYKGFSGGPVIEIEEVNTFERRYRVIGVVTQFVPAVESWLNQSLGYSNQQMFNSGYSIAVPMDPILELIK